MLVRDVSGVSYQALGDRRLQVICLSWGGAHGEGRHWSEGSQPDGRACEEHVEAYHLKAQSQTLSGGTVDYRKYKREECTEVHR